MGRALTICGAILASLLTVFAAVAPARGHKPPVSVLAVGGRQVVQPGSAATFGATCPVEAPHPVGGEIVALTPAEDGQIALSESYPVGRRGWHISVADLTDQPHGFGAAVVCVAARAKFVYPRVSDVVQPERPEGDFIRCPEFAPNPLASVFKLQPGSSPGSAIVVAMSQTYHKSRVSNVQLGAMRNLTNQPVGVVVGAVCSSLRVTTQQASGTVSPGQVDGFTFRCPLGQFAVGGAFFPNQTGLFPDMALVDSFRLRPALSKRRWAVAVKNLGTSPIPYVAAEVCVG